MDELAQEVSDIICDYADNKFGKLDKYHVLRWVSQFDENERQIVLAETKSILNKTYITKNNFEKFTSSLVKNTDFSTNDPLSYWKKVSLLDIQINGKSQKELVKLLSRSVFEQLDITPFINKISNNYIYMDDFIFTGDRLSNDFNAWVMESAPDACHVNFVVMGWYTYGHYNLSKKIPSLIKQSGKRITFKFWSFPELRLENRLKYKNTSHVCWPEKKVLELPQISNYVNSFQNEPPYRELVNDENKIFSANRFVFETAMLKAGLKIRSFSQNPKPILKPLGYKYYEGFGFGSLVFSFRNCPNNAPLAFWWGDPSQPNSTLGKWYPLMQRVTYNE